MKKVFSLALSFIFVFCILPFPSALAANDPETTVIVEDLGDGITVETTIQVYPNISRNSSKSAIASSRFLQGDTWIATVTLKAYFTYNGITSGVTGTEYSRSLASGWTYTNHNISTTTVSSSSGGTARLTATLKNFPTSVPVDIILHCAPNGTVTTNQ